MDWDREREVVLKVFTAMLSQATGDGSKKRQAGKKEPWWRDTTHEESVFSHIHKWKRGDLVDEDSGAHPLVNGAWRMLAIAFQETYGTHDPDPYVDDVYEEMMYGRDDKIRPVASILGSNNPKAR